MAQDEMILVAIEEMAKQLAEMKKAYSQTVQNVNVDLSPINEKLTATDQKLNILKDSVSKYQNDVSQAVSTIRLIEGVLQRERKSVVHKYIEVKKPFWWIITIVSYVLISFSIGLFLYQNNQKLSINVELHKANDLKYRFIKLRDDKISDLQKILKTTGDLTYSIDSYYSKHQKEVEQFVFVKEEAIKKEYEAAEIAKQRQIDAKKAQNEAERLKEKSESVKIK